MSLIISLLYFLFVIQLTEVTLFGRSGQAVPSHVEEDEKRVIGNAPILYRNMAGKIVQISDNRLRQQTAMRTDVQVNIIFLIDL